MKRYELISLTLKDNETNEIKEILYDELDIVNLFNKQDTKWKKLKEWVEKRKSWNERQLKEAPINTEFYIRVSVQGTAINKILDKMQELEGEDE